MPTGAAIRTGISRTSRPSSAAPDSCAAPPVRITPAGSMPTPAARISLRSSSNVSRIRASMICETSSRLTVRPASSPSTATLISSSSPIADRSHVPCRILSSSATWMLVLSPIATSFVTFAPPTGSTRVWNGEPSWNNARSIVPAPTSATATPSSFSVSLSTASAEASPSTTSSSILTPAADTHLVRFCTAVAEAVTMCVSTSRRRALIPSGSLTPSWPSTVNPRRSTWSTSRFDGIGIVRDCSTARRMSSRLTSWVCAATDTWPVEFRLSTCAPPTPTNALSIFQPDSRSARSTASRIERTVCSMFTTAPRFRPDEGTVPWPITVRRPSRAISPISAQTLLDPTSSATRTPSTTSPTSDEVPPDEGDVVEDPQSERDQRHQVQVQPQPVSDEREDDRHDRVGDEARDEDPVVVDAVELCPHRAEHRVQRGEDRHGRVAAELEADVDVEDEPEQDAHQQACQGEEQRSRPRCGTFGERLSPWGGLRSCTGNIGAVGVRGEDDPRDAPLAAVEEAPEQAHLARDHVGRPGGRA